MVTLSILGVNPKHLTDMAPKDETVNAIFSLTENNMELPKSLIVKFKISQKEQ